MNIFRKLFRCCSKCKNDLIQDATNPRESIQVDETTKKSDNTRHYSEAESTIISLLQEILDRIDTDSTQQIDELTENLSPSTDECIEHRCENTNDLKEEVQSGHNIQSKVISNTKYVSADAIEALCAKIVSWEEQKEVISSMSPIDVIYFIIRDCKQLLQDLNVPIISDEKKFIISRHEPVELNGKIPRPGDEIDSFVEEGFEIDGKVLIRAKVKLK